MLNLSQLVTMIVSHKLMVVTEVLWKLAINPLPDQDDLYSVCGSARASGSWWW